MKSLILKKDNSMDINKKIEDMLKDLINTILMINDLDNMLSMNKPLPMSFLERYKKKWNNELPQDIAYSQEESIKTSEFAEREKNKLLEEQKELFILLDNEDKANINKAFKVIKELASYGDVDFEKIDKILKSNLKNY